MNYKNVTVIIVSFKSEKVIFKCLKSIHKVSKIIIVDNSNDKDLKKKVLFQYPKVKFILSSLNLGYGSANNIALKKINTKYAMIINPDVCLYKNCIFYLQNLAKYLKDNFSIIAPMVVGKEKNYGFFSDIFKKIFLKKNYFEIDFAKGSAMFLNVKKIKKINYFDENFFMYLEEIDLCKRLKNINEKIFLCKNAKFTHLGGKSSNIGFNFEINRNWHWMWSKLYFASKYQGFFHARIKALPILLKLLLKTFFYIIFFNYKKMIINFARLTGLFASFLNLKSYYRPNLNKKN